jgi:uncharacterized protein YbjT (DUF2867 family)
MWIFQRKANDPQRTPPITSGPTANSGSLAKAATATTGKRPPGRARSGLAHYFSVFDSALFDDVPHFASKHLAERVIDAQALPATVLRPAAFMQNDLMLRDALKAGVYPQPIGGVGLAMVDIRDITDAAAAELLRRERAPHPLPRTTIELVGPDTLTGAELAAIWASVLGHDVRYGGDDLAAYEKQAAGMMPGWQAHDFRVMLRAMQRFGMIPEKDSRAIFEALIGHPLRSYRAFAKEAAANW